MMENIPFIIKENNIGALVLYKFSTYLQFIAIGDWVLPDNLNIRVPKNIFVKIYSISNAFLVFYENTLYVINKEQYTTIDNVQKYLILDDCFIILNNISDKYMIYDETGTRYDLNESLENCLRTLNSYNIYISGNTIILRDTIKTTNLYLYNFSSGKDTWCVLLNKNINYDMNYNLFDKNIFINNNNNISSISASYNLLLQNITDVICLKKDYFLLKIQKTSYVIFHKDIYDITPGLDNKIDIDIDNTDSITDSIRYAFSITYLLQNNFVINTETETETENFNYTFNFSDATITNCFFRKNKSELIIQYSNSNNNINLFVLPLLQPVVYKTQSLNFIQTIVFANRYIQYFMKDCIQKNVIQFVCTNSNIIILDKTQNNTYFIKFIDIENTYTIDIPVTNPFILSLLTNSSNSKTISNIYSLTNNIIIISRSDNFILLFHTIAENFIPPVQNSILFLLSNLPQNNEPINSIIIQVLDYLQVK